MDILSNIQWLIVGIVTFAGSIFFSVIRNHKIILEKGKVKHTPEWLVKALFCTPSIVAFSLGSNFIYVVAVIVSSIMIAFNFWLFFDSALNVIRKKPLFFYGSEDGKDDANTDNFLQGLPIWLGALIKILLALGSAYLYIIGYGT